MESLQQGWLDCYESWKLPDLALLENNAGPLRHDLDASSPILTVMLHVVIYALQPDNSSLYLILLQNRQKVKALEQQLKVACHSKCNSL